MSRWRGRKLQVGRVAVAGLDHDCRRLGGPRDTDPACWLHHGVAGVIGFESEGDGLQHEEAIRVGHASLAERIGSEGQPGAGEEDRR